MRRSRLCAILAIVVLGAVGAVFASTAEGKSQADVRIGVFLASAANTYWTAELQGARDVAKKYGNVKLTVYDAAYLELARRRQLPLTSMDRDLRDASAAAGVEVLGVAA